MLFNQRLKTFYMGKKARTVVLGERGKEPIYIIPKPKPVFEYNGWVLKAKVISGILAVLAILSGAVASLLGWKILLIVVALGFLIAFIRGGDVESSP